MKSLLDNHRLLTLLAVVVLVAGCKQPETIVIDDTPTAVAPSDTTEQDVSNEASFRKLVVGEYNSISTLDPLFADNASAMRAVQLAYEGLVRLNADNQIVAGMAKRWEVSSDSLTYTFHLREDVYYHDSDVFSTGTGRRMVASDVKHVFERMAKAEVPPTAAHLFMDIKGFDPYFHEQRSVYYPADRKRDGVTGIEAQNDSTVVFELIEKDPDFLNKLATPLAVIYPKEAVGRTVESFSAVGTGPFSFSSRQADSTLIFSKFQNYYSSSDIQLNRVDIVPNSSESQLFRSMGSGDIHLLPQLGPQLVESVINANGQLSSSYKERYDLQQADGFIEFVLRHNPNSNLTASDAEAISKLIAADSTSYFEQFPGTIIRPVSPEDSIAQNTNLQNLPGQIYTVFSEDPYVRTFLGSFSNTLEQYNTQLQMMEIQAPSRNTGLFFTQNYPVITDTQWQRYKPLFRFRVAQTSLMRTEISGLDFNNYPWWFDLRDVTLPSVETLN